MDPYLYSRWDGSQNIEPFSPDDLMDSLADDLMEEGDLRSSLERLFRYGKQDEKASYPGLQDLLDKLRQKRQESLEKYDLGSVLDDIKERLDNIVKTEREGIDKRLESAQNQAADGQKPDPRLQKALEKIANGKKEQLNNLPPDPGGQIKQLTDYDFMDQDAREQFGQLMDMLRKQMLGSQFEGMKQALQNITPEDLQAMRDMVKDLNQMLREKMQGGNPDFQSFKDQHSRFVPEGVNSLEEMIEHMQRQAARAQSMMNSLSPEMRQSLQDITNSLLQDDRLKWDMMQLAANLEQLMPRRQFQGKYPFEGEESLSMEEAMKLMNEMQEIDELSRQLRQARNPEALENIDKEKLQGLLGKEAVEDLDKLQQITKMLEEAGYLQKKGDHYELTAKGIRRIGEKALRDIFGKLKKDAFGKHEVEQTGQGGERGEETKLYEFGDPFHLDTKGTVMNALIREGVGSPVKLQPSDFAVYRTDHQTDSSLVLMIDMSRSMLLRGCFGAAKKVGLALNSLIRSQYPKDNLYIVLFSEYAQKVQPEAIPELSWDENSYGTNLQHGLMMARQLLGRHKSGNKQIIIITDGEPTAHLEDGVAQFNYPPTMRTVLETLREVERCTRDRIVINTFMLEKSRPFVEFVNKITEINHGRAFFATPERLGEYVLVDYVANKKKKIA